MAIEREKSPQERGATLQGFNGREIPLEAAEKILDVLDKTIDQFLAAKQAQKIEKDVPTRVLEDGTKEWRNEAGALHRGNGPAVVFLDAEGEGFRWYQNGLLHREDGPAKEYVYAQGYYGDGNPDSDRSWYKNGQLHREGGPAIEQANGKKEYYLRKTPHPLSR